MVIIILFFLSGSWPVRVILFFRSPLGRLYLSTIANDSQYGRMNK